MEERKVVPIGRIWHAEMSPTAQADVQLHLSRLKAFQGTSPETVTGKPAADSGLVERLGALDVLVDRAEALTTRVFTVALAVVAVAGIAVLALAVVGAGYLIGGLR